MPAKSKGKSSDPVSAATPEPEVPGREYGNGADAGAGDAADDCVGIAEKGILSIPQAGAGMEGSGLPTSGCDGGEKVRAQKSPDSETDKRVFPLQGAEEVSNSKSSGRNAGKGDSPLQGKGAGKADKRVRVACDGGGEDSSSAVAESSPQPDGLSPQPFSPRLSGDSRDGELPRHLLVLRTTAMGDVAMLPHALRALKSAYPSLRITVATQAMFRPFFAGLEVEFLDVDTKGEHRSLAGMWRLAAQARRLGVDAVADVHDVLRSQAFRLAMRLHGIPAAHIRKGRVEKRRFIRCGGRGMEPLRHTVLRYCDVFRELGFRFDNPAPSTRRGVGTLQTLSDSACPLVPDPVPAAANLRYPNPFGEKQGVWIGFAPFSAHRGKTYPEAQSRELVHMLAERYDRIFIHGGGGAEAGFAAEMERTYPNVTALWGKVRFAGEIDLIANLDCVITMDSLVMHLAALVATPVVSVWGATHPGLGFLGYGAAPEGILQADLPCRPCSVFGSKPCRYGDYRCLLAVTPAMIVRRVAWLLGEQEA